MGHVRSITRAVFLVVFTEVIIDATMLQAEQVLLAELYHSQSTPDDAGETFNFRFHTGTSIEDQVELSRTPSPAEVGQTFPADPVTLAKFDRILTSCCSGVDSSFGTFQAIPRSADTNEFFNGPFMGEIPPVHSPDINKFILNAYVPQLGPGFSGYRITSLTQTINGMSMEQLNPSTFLYWGAHTIRIFGEQVPEPRMSLLVAQALICLAWVQKRSFTRRVWYVPDNKN